MRSRLLFIGRWVVYFLFAEDKYEPSEILPVLYEFGAPDEIIDHVEELIDSNCPDTGFTYADESIYRALVVIGPSSSGEEFIDTLVHEVHHLAVAIASKLGIDLEGEVPAYLSGDSARELADLICELGCPRCRHGNACS